MGWVFSIAAGSASTQCSPVSEQSFGYSLCGIQNLGQTPNFFAMHLMHLTIADDASYGVFVEVFQQLKKERAS